MKHGALASSWMRNGARIYAMPLKYKVYCVLNLVIFGSSTTKSDKQFHSMMPRERHQLALAIKAQLIGRILHTFPVREDV